VQRSGDYKLTLAKNVYGPEGPLTELPAEAAAELEKAIRAHQRDERRLAAKIEPGERSRPSGLAG
jgi:hypothetical protein